MTDLQEFASYFATCESHNTDEWMEHAAKLLDDVADESAQTITLAGSTQNYRFVLRGKGTALDEGDT